MVFNTHFMAMQISITKRHIEKIIWIKPIDLVQVSDVKVKQGVLNTLFGRQEYQLRDAFKLMLQYSASDWLRQLGHQFKNLIQCFIKKSWSLTSDSNIQR